MYSCGIILSGGESSRMGTNKSFLIIDGKPVISHIVNEMRACTDTISVVTNNPCNYTFLETDICCDRYVSKGPLAGIESAMYHNDASIYMVAACDMPFIDKSIYKYLLKSLGDADAVVPVFNGKTHPLAGIYTKNVLPHIQQLLESDQLKVHTLFQMINVLYVTCFEGIQASVAEKHFFNMNDLNDYKQAKRL